MTHEVFALLLSLLIGMILGVVIAEALMASRINNLKARLAKAEANDSRDPNSGRYVRG